MRKNLTATPQALPSAQGINSSTSAYTSLNSAGPTSASLTPHKTGTTIGNTAKTGSGPIAKASTGGPKSATQLQTSTSNQSPPEAAEDRCHGHIHIDRFTLNGPLNHDPLGELFYSFSDLLGHVVAGASAYTPKRRKNPRPDDIYIKSSMVNDQGTAQRLLFDCCPPQILQGHNVFGHGNLLDYGYAIFLGQLAKHGLTATPQEHDWWKTGRSINVSEVHLTGNFWVPPHLKMMFINAIDEANRGGKHRNIESCIALGFNASRRSTQQGVCIYDETPKLLKQWSNPGGQRIKLMEYIDGSIRIEVRLYEGGLAYRDLKSAAKWADVDVDQLFFEILSGFNVGNAIQPLLTEDEEKELSHKELITYILWLLKQDIRRFLSASTISRHARSIKRKVGIDILSERRPERLPRLDLTEILTVENIVPVPDWLVEIDRYRAPGRHA